jgi:translation initiation factor 3 subunit M
MPGPVSTLLVEGTFDELAEELSIYIDNLRKTQGEEETVRSEVIKYKDSEQKDDALKALVGASAVLNSAPEKGETEFAPGAEDSALTPV